MTMIKIDSKQKFEGEISSGTSLIQFNATWCGPCRMLKPHVEALSNEMTDVKFLDVDVDINPEIAKEYNVQSIPMLVLVREGKPAKQHVGFIDPNSLKQFVK